jgi:enoyl-CoA hydratase/carnithine racemase
LTWVGQTLSWRLKGETLIVELHRAPCNEIGTTTLLELEKLAELIRNGAGGARAMVLHSSLPAGFCAGADLKELHAGLHKMDDQTHGVRRLARMAAKAVPVRRVRDRVVQHRVRRFLDRVHNVFDTIDTAPLTTIAMVHGVVFGGGFELALTCDVIVAERTARFAFPELRLGLVPGFGGIPRLNRDVGNAVVRDLLLTGRSIRAKRAHEVGLVAQIVNKDQGLDTALRVAEQAALFDRNTATEAKAFMKRLPVAELLREKQTFCRLVTSPVVKEALDRFVSSQSARPYLP